jgi:hypothetical protein
MKVIVFGYKENNNYHSRALRYLERIVLSFAAISIQILTCKLTLEHGCKYCCHLLSLSLAVTAFCTFAWLETITVTGSMLGAI